MRQSSPSSTDTHFFNRISNITILGHVENSRKIIPDWHGISVHLPRAPPVAFQHSSISSTGNSNSDHMEMNTSHLKRIFSMSTPIRSTWRRILPTWSFSSFQLQFGPHGAHFRPIENFAFRWKRRSNWRYFHFNGQLFFNQYWRILDLVRNIVPVHLVVLIIHGIGTAVFEHKDLFPCVPRFLHVGSHRQRSGHPRAD